MHSISLARQAICPVSPADGHIYSTSCCAQLISPLTAHIALILNTFLHEMLHYTRNNSQYMECDLSVSPFGLSECNQSELYSTVQRFVQTVKYQ